MAGTRISQFPNLPSGSLASEDVLLVVDISDTFYSPSGTNKSTTVGDLSNFFSNESGITAFTGLTDTPSALGSAGQSVVVSSDGNSLIFSGVTGSGGGTGSASSFTDLTDTPLHIFWSLLCSVQGGKDPNAVSRGLDVEW